MRTTRPHRTFRSPRQSSGLAKRPTPPDAVDRIGRTWLADGQLAAGDLREMRERLAALQTLYAAHTAVEDRELFPAAGRLLSPDRLCDIGEEMKARRTPTRK